MSNIHEMDNDTKEVVARLLAVSFCTYLNTLLALDHDAIELLTNFHAPCNESLADDPILPVQTREDGSPEVGMLGVFNGLIGGPYIFAVFDDKTGKLIEFRPKEA